MRSFHGRGPCTCLPPPPGPLTQDTQLLRDQPAPFSPGSPLRSSPTTCILRPLPCCLGGSPTPGACSPPPAPARRDVLGPPTQASALATPPRGSALRTHECTPAVPRLFSLLLSGGTCGLVTAGSPSPARLPTCAAVLKDHGCWREGGGEGGRRDQRALLAWGSGRSLWGALVPVRKAGPQGSKGKCFWARGR